MTQVQEGILPLKKSNPIINNVEPFTYYYNYGQTYNHQNPDPHWYNLPAKGGKYTICGHLWKGEYKGCLNVSGHALNPKTAGKIHLRKIGASCYRMECPICYKKAIARASWNIGRKFMRMPAYNHILDTNKKQKTLSGTNVTTYEVKKRERVKSPEDRTPYGKPIHLVISPNRTDALLSQTVVGHKKLMKIARRIAKKIGFNGGCMIFHPWRSKKETLQADAEPGIEINLDTGVVNHENLNLYIDKHGIGANTEWHVSPHFHLIGYAKDCIDGVKVAQQYAKTGWISVNLGVRKSVTHTAFYQLTHCGVKKGEHTVIWFGIMSNGKGWFSKNALEPLQVKPAQCPECSEDLKNYIWTGDNDKTPLADEPEGKYWIKAQDIDLYQEVRKLHADYIVEENTALDDLNYISYPLPEDPPDKYKS